jgi:hypothetical protein
MNRWIVLTTSVLIFAIALVPVAAEDLVVFTAHQSFDSRIYVLRPDGSTRDMYEAFNFYAADVEVVDGEVYVVEAFQPKVVRLDIDTGQRTPLITDISLIVFYDVAYGARIFAGADLDGDSRAEILVGCGPDPSRDTRVRVFDYNGGAVTILICAARFPAVRHPRGQRGGWDILRGEVWHRGRRNC